MVAVEASGVHYDYDDYYVHFVHMYTYLTQTDYHTRE